MESIRNSINYSDLTSNYTSIIKNMQKVIVRDHAQVLQDQILSLPIILQSIENSDTLSDLKNISNEVFAQTIKNLDACKGESSTGLSEKSLSLISSAQSLLSALPELSNPEIASHATKLIAEVSKITVENNDTLHSDSTKPSRDTNLLILSLEVAISMMQINATSAKLLSLSTNKINQVLSDLDQLQQFLAHLSQLYQEYLYAQNAERARKDSNTPQAPTIDWNSIYGSFSPGVLLSQAQTPDIMKKFAKTIPLYNNDYSITPSVIKDTIKYVSQELALVLPNKNASNNGDLYDTFSSAWEDNKQVDAFNGALSNKIKAVNDVISNISSQVSLHQNNAQNPINDFESLLSLYNQFLSHL